MVGFIIPALKELTDQQVRFTPPAKRREQLLRAERLLGDIDPNRRYPYQFVCFRITEFRPDSYADLLIGGEALVHDLQLMIESLTVPADPKVEGIVTLDEISKQLNVSTKTIRRWRKLGLVGRRVVCNGKTQIGYTQSVIERFLATHPDRVQRGGQFSQMSEYEKEEILRRAKRLSRVNGGTLTEVSRRIARKLGRSAETIRYTIKNHRPGTSGPGSVPEPDRAPRSGHEGHHLQLLPTGDSRGYTSQTLPAHPYVDVPGHQRSPCPTAAWSSRWITSRIPRSRTRPMKPGFWRRCRTPRPTRPGAAR